MSDVKFDNHYSGHRKLERVSNGLTKTLCHLGTSVDLFTADFYTIEKLAGLIHLEKHLRWRINTCNNNLAVRARIYELLLDIADKKPIVTGYLTKARLFTLVNNTWEGLRLINNFNVRKNLKSAFPHCFRYDDDDVSDVNLGKLVSLMKFGPPAVKQPANFMTLSDAMYYFTLFSILTFITGTIYGFILCKGLTLRS